MSSREVFALRKSGRIAEALQMARRDYAAFPGDLWNVKALAWSLHSVIREEQDVAAKTALAREFLELPIPADDELLQNTRAGIQRQVEPFAADLRAARELARAGDHVQSLARLRALVGAYPNAEPVAVALAWELCREIQQGVKEVEPDGPDLWARVEEYMGLTTVPKPSEVHSRMLQWVAVMARKKLAPRFCQFFQWWDPARNLRAEDFEGRTKEGGGRYDSVVENVIAGLAKTVENCAEERAKRTAAEFIETHAHRYPGQEWFPYYRAIGQLVLGHAEDAKALLVPIVRSKSTEFWAWQRLAECFVKGSEQELACLCRAAICPVPGEEYLLGVYTQLGCRLLEGEHAGEGRHLLEKVRAIRLGKEWGLTAQLDSALLESEVVLPVDADPLLREWAPRADEILLGDLPWLRAVLSGLNVELPRDGQTRRYHFVKIATGAGAESLIDGRIPSKRSYAYLEGLPLGSPLSVRADFSGPHPRILSMKARPGGELWDVCPQSTGTVTHVNPEKGVAAIGLASGQTGLAYFNACPGANGLIVGCKVECRWTERNGRIRILAVKASHPRNMDCFHEVA